MTRAEVSTSQGHEAELTKNRHDKQLSSKANLSLDRLTVVQASKLDLFAEDKLISLVAEYKQELDCNSRRW